MTKHHNARFLIAGDPIKGFQYIGPFENFLEATKWAEENVVGPDWWVGVLLPTDTKLEKKAA